MVLVGGKVGSGVAPATCDRKRVDAAKMLHFCTVFKLLQPLRCPHPIAPARSRRWSQESR